MSESSALVPLEHAHIHEGLEVHHPKYGKGKVLVWPTASKFDEIKIHFETAGIKSLLFKFCQLSVSAHEAKIAQDQTGTFEERQQAAKAELLACAEELFQHAQASSEGIQHLIQTLIRRLHAHALALKDIYPQTTLTEMLYTEARHLHENNPHTTLAYDRQTSPFPASAKPESNASLVGGRGGRGAVVTDKEYHGD